LPSDSQSDPQDSLNGKGADGNAIALLLVDLISEFEFPGGDQLLREAFRIAPALKELKRRAKGAGVPIVYANDNFGRWQSSFQQLLSRCLSPNCQSRSFVEQFAPECDDYVVLKPKHSAFFQTPLDILLKHLGTRKLVLAGFCTNSCILFTAQDAYMRDLELIIPADCVASYTIEDHETALQQMKMVTKADVSPSALVQF
jgi:nicotinamidase-related amidase